MYSTHSFIDIIQNAKKAYTNKVITDPELNKMANEFITSQTQFVKTLANNTEKMTKYLFDSISK